MTLSKQELPCMCLFDVDDVRKRVRLQQPGPRCGQCSVAALCGNAGYEEFELWLRKRLLVHVYCPRCEQHGTLSVRTGKEVFPAPDGCPVLLLHDCKQKIFTKLCMSCYRGQQIRYGGMIEPFFEEKKMVKRKWANDDGSEPETVEIDFDSIVDREELRTCYAIGDEEIWLPNSQVKNEDEMQGTLEIPEWLAKDRGLI